MAGDRCSWVNRVFLTLFAIYALPSRANGLQCISNDGKPVDWFIAYKLPGSESQETNSFFYMDPNNKQWQLSKITLTDPGQAVAFTLKQIYGSEEDKGSNLTKEAGVLYAMYNDELPENSPYKWRSTNHGHTKGVIGFDQMSGFWLVHSTPKFPPPKTDGYSWPSSAETYGQSFLCMSLRTATNLDNIGKQFLYNYPQFYDKNIPEHFNKYKSLVSALSGSKVKSAPWSNEVQLTTLGGIKFRSFAKYTNFDADLYSDWLAPTFKSPLLVETWQNGRGKMCSNCTGPYKVFNIATLQFPSTEVAFKETQDHSKWAVTNTTSAIWTCIGDINRQVPQMKRPGGTVCFQDKRVWSQFHAIIHTIHNCGPYRECIPPDGNQYNKYAGLDELYKKLFGRESQEIKF